MTESSFRRYRPPTGIQVEFQPGSRGRVLLNKLGIVRKREMDGVEYAALLKAQQRYIAIVGPDTRFAAALLRRLHKDWLGEIYA
jgi:cell filamentation protein